MATTPVFCANDAVANLSASSPMVTRLGAKGAQSSAVASPTVPQIPTVVTHQTRHCTRITMTGFPPTATIHLPDPIPFEILWSSMLPPPDPPPTPRSPLNPY